MRTYSRYSIGYISRGEKTAGEADPHFSYARIKVGAYPVPLNAELYGLCAKNDARGDSALNAFTASCGSTK